jgi:hypothetical protein
VLGFSPFGFDYLTFQATKESVDIIESQPEIPLKFSQILACHGDLARQSCAFVKQKLADKAQSGALWSQEHFQGKFFDLFGVIQRWGSGRCTPPAGPHGSVLEKCDGVPILSIREINACTSALILVSGL